MRFYDSSIVERVGFDFYCDIANNIVKVRKTLDLTQKDLAEKSGIKEHRISGIESVKVRIGLDDLKKLSEVLKVSTDYLIDAELDWNGEECLYQVWTESVPEFKVYIKSTSKRMAFLDFDKRLRISGVRYENPRERAFVKLVGVPISDKDFQARFPKRIANEELLIEPD